MSDKIEYSRLLLKRTGQTGQVPTIPPLSATSLNEMISTDLFVGELFLNDADDLLWIRTDNGILPIALSGSTGSTTPTLGEVLFESNYSNGFDITMSSGNTIVFEQILSGVTATYLGLDASGNTITTVGGSGGEDLQSTLVFGNTTGSNDIIVNSGQTIIYSGLSTGSTSNFLALDADNRTIITSAGASGTSGTSGAAGTNGTSGVNGTNGTSGVNGTNGSSGVNGTNGTSGVNGTNGSSGVNGTNGSSGTDGTSGVSGATGSSGTSGVNGTNGSSGTDGTSGVSGATGSSGTSGTNGTDGTSGVSGATGSSGTSGTNGTSGVDGISTSLFYYEAKDNSQSGNPGNGHILWDNVTMTASTQININHLTDTPITDIDIFLALLGVGQKLTIQDRSNSDNFQVWTITGATTQITGATNYWTVPVSLVSLGGNPQFANNHQIFLAIVSASGTNGTSGTNGAAGTSGTNGAAGTAGTSGTSGTGGGGGGSSSYGTHFGFNFATGQTYNFGLTTTYVEVSSLVNFQSRIIAYPVTPQRNVSFSAMTMDIYRLNGNTAGRFKMLLYDNNPTLFLPSTLLVESTDLTPAQFAILQYNVNYTLSAGTTYWFGIAISGNMSGPVGAHGYNMAGMMTIGAPNFTDGTGLSYKYAVSETIASYPTISSTWITPSTTTSFNGSTLFAPTYYYGGTNAAPEIRIKIG